MGPGRKLILGIAGILLITWATLSLAYDYTLLHGITGYDPPFTAGSNCTTIIFDPAGILSNGSNLRGACYTRRFTLADAVNLWRLNASRIVIVTHAFKGENVFGLGVTGSGVSGLARLLYHPLILVYTGTGRIHNGGKTMIIDYKVFKYNRSLKGKVILLVSCEQGGLGKLARILESKGARVCYTNSTITMESVARKVVLDFINNGGMSGSSLLVECIGGGER